ncbi:MAG TPA: fumarylacetoacetate hydrolase family protein [Methylomirabilota bacterium]|jgi:2-keto-4-pentenoate hydratase/2-oxohepta-3-ene-1,7-dioic acid hydratase in catechol pathway|nr:fumarylacetoacetate hydrolase family protein [Methylomirabilota bacterium]
MPYKLLSYQAGRTARAGVLVEDAVYDAAKVTGVAAHASVLGVLEDWSRARRLLAQAAKRLEAGRGRGRAKGIPLKRVKLLAPVLYPGNIYCAGANYTDHMAEMARAQGQAPGPNMKELGEKPWHFVKSSRSAVVGPGARVKLPVYSQMVDWEVELAAVIGRPARDVTVEKALDYVAGYTIADDLSARDVMRRDKNPATSPFHYDWLSQKCFDGACPLGPWIVPASEIPYPQNLALKLWVNDKVMQDSHTGKMIFSTAEQIAMLSSRVTLYPGDLILTGTPAGVGMPRRTFLKAGDTVKLWIEGIGDLTHTMTS